MQSEFEITEKRVIGKPFEKGHTLGKRFSEEYHPKRGKGAKTLIRDILEHRVLVSDYFLPPEERKRRKKAGETDKVMMTVQEAIVSAAAIQAMQGDATSRAWLFDRLYGKPTQTVEATVNSNHNMRYYTEDELKSLLREMEENENNENWTEAEIVEEGQ